MKTLTALSIAIAMAFAFSGPVVFTSPPANAGDIWCDAFVHCEEDGGTFQGLLGEIE